MTAPGLAIDTADYASLAYRPPRAIRWGLSAALVPIVLFVLEPLVPAALAALGIPVPPVAGLAIGVAAYAVAVGWALLVSRRLGQRSLRADFGWAIRPVDLGLGLLAAIGVELVRIVVGIVLTAATPLRPTTNVHLAATVPGNIALGIVAVLLAPIVEELLTRGLLMRAIRNAVLRRAQEPSDARRHAAVDVSVVLSAAVFTALHLHEAPDLVTGVALTLGIFPFGLVVGWLATRTGRLGPGIVTHVLINALAFAAALTVG